MASVAVLVMTVAPVASAASISQHTPSVSASAASGSGSTTLARAAAPTGSTSAIPNTLPRPGGGLPVCNAQHDGEYVIYEDGDYFYIFQCQYVDGQWLWIVVSSGSGGARCPNGVQRSAARLVSNTVIIC